MGGRAAGLLSCTTALAACWGETWQEKLWLGLALPVGYGIGDLHVFWRCTQSSGADSEDNTSQEPECIPIVTQKTGTLANDGRSWTLPVVIVALVLAIAGVAIYLATRKSSSEPEKRHELHMV